MYYFDAAATTPIKPEVKKAMERASGLFGNVGSFHLEGKRAEKEYLKAKKVMAEILGVHEGQIVITQGGTDANQRVITYFQRKFGTKSVYASAIEHSSIRNIVNPENLYNPFLGNSEPLLQNKEKSVKLVCQMFANNETGVILPKVDKKAGQFWLCDWVQGLFKSPKASGNPKDFVQGSNADFITISAHKFGGPKNVGAIIVKNPRDFAEIIDDHRTINLQNVVGMAKAMELAQNQAEKLQKLTDLFEKAFEENGIVKNYHIHHQKKNRVGGITSLAIKNVRGSELMKILSREEEIGVSTGSACNRDLLSPTHVLRFINPDPAFLYPIRVSFLPETREEDVDFLIQAIKHYAREKFGLN